MATIAVVLVMALSSAIVLTADQEAVADADILEWEGAQNIFASNAEQLTSAVDDNGSYDKVIITVTAITGISQGLNFDDGKLYKLVGNGSTISFTGISPITVSNGSTLVIENLTVNGLSGAITIKVTEDGHLILGDGSVITKGGVGVVVQDNTGTGYSSLEILEGAKVTENTGCVVSNILSGNTRVGGVLVEGSLAKFTMTGGEISNNTGGSYAGGLAILSGASAEISGGTIANNTRTGSESSVGGNDIHLWGANVTLTGGTIGNGTGSQHVGKYDTGTVYIGKPGLNPSSELKVNKIGDVAIVINGNLKTGSSVVTSAEIPTIDSDKKFATVSEQMMSYMKGSGDYSVLGCFKNGDCGAAVYDSDHLVNKDGQTVISSSSSHEDGDVYFVFNSEGLFVSNTNGDDTNGNGTRGSPYKTVSKAYDVAKNVNGDVTIFLLTNVPGAELSGESTGTVTITSAHGGSRSITGVFTIPSGAKVRLADITVDGNNVDSPLIEINGGTLTLDNRATVQNGQIGIKVSSGTLNIKEGAKIQNFSGGMFYTTYPTYSTAGAIAVLSGGKVVMDGGIITGNTSNNGSAITLAPGSSAVINDGTIENNTSRGNYGAIYVWNGTLTLNGGTIQNNTGGGVRTYNNTGTINIGTADQDPTVPLKITGNKIGGSAANLVLDGKVFKVQGGLADDSSIGVYTSAVPTASAPVRISTGNSNIDGYFHSDRVSSESAVIGGNIYLRMDSDLYVSAYGSDSAGNGSRENPYRTIAHAYSMATSNSTITLLTDITLTSPLTFNRSISVTITSDADDCTIFRGGVTAGDLITVTGSGVSVTLTNITIDGSGKAEKNSLLVTNGATLTLGDGCTVQNGGSGVWLVGPRAGQSGAKPTLNILEGSMITGHTGFTRFVTSGQTTTVGGVGVTGKSTFLMTGGTITGNTGYYAGGIGFVHNDVGSSPTIVGGTISNNRAQASGGAGGIYLWEGVVQLAGGSIIDNIGGGVGSYQQTGRLVIGIGNLEGQWYYSSIEPLVIEGNKQNASDSTEKNLRLNNGETFGIRGSLVDGSSIGVWTTSVPTASKDVQIAKNEWMGLQADKRFVEFFRSDRMDAGVILDIENRHYARTGDDIDTGGHTYSENSLWISVAAAQYNSPFTVVIEKDGQTNVIKQFGSFQELVDYLNNPGDDFEGASKVTVNMYADAEHSGTITIPNLGDDGEFVIDGNGHTIDHVEGGGNGSLFVIGSGSNLTLTDVTIDGNGVERVDGIDTGTGSGIMVDGGSLTVGSGTTIQNYNKAENPDWTGGDGSAIYVKDGGSLTIGENKAEVSDGYVPPSIIGNMSEGDGGAVYIEKPKDGSASTITVNNSDVSGNTAGGYGDGLTSVGSVVNVTSDISDSVGLIESGSKVEVVGSPSVSLDVDPSHGFNSVVATPSETGTGNSTANVTLEDHDGLHGHEIYDGTGDNEGDKLYAGFEAEFVQTELGKVDMNITAAVSGTGSNSLGVTVSKPNNLIDGDVSGETTGTNPWASQDYTITGDGKVDVSITGTLTTDGSSGTYEDSYFIIHETDREGRTDGLVEGAGTDIMAGAGTYVTDVNGNRVMFDGTESIPAHTIATDDRGNARFELPNGDVSVIDIGQQVLNSYKAEMQEKLEHILNDFGFDEETVSNIKQSITDALEEVTYPTDGPVSMDSLIGAVDKVFNDSIMDMLKEAFGDNVTVTGDSESGFVVDVNGNIGESVTISGSLGDVTVNLNGHTISNNEGEPAITINDDVKEENQGSDVATGTDLVINGPGSVIGSDGSDASDDSAATDGSAGILVDSPDCSITVTGDAVVQGGSGGDANSTQTTPGNGGAGIDGYIGIGTVEGETVISGGTQVTVEDGGQVIGGDGGKGIEGDGNAGGTGGSGIVTGGDVSVDDGKVSGGNGGDIADGDGIGGTGGTGGDAINAGGNVDITNGSEVSGGNGGSGETTGEGEGAVTVPGISGGDGGSAVSGVTTTVGDGGESQEVGSYPDSVVVDDSDVSGGNGGDGTDSTTADGGQAGDGGDAIVSEGPVDITNGSEVSGGSGGQGGDGSGSHKEEETDVPNDGGDGGSGGSAVNVPDGSVSGVDVTIDGSTVSGGSAGNGGDSENGTGGNGGDGGTAVDNIPDGESKEDAGTAGTTTVTGGSEVTGGAGGQGGGGSIAGSVDGEINTGNGGNGGDAIKGNASVDTSGTGNSQVNGGAGGDAGSVDTGKAPSGGDGGSAISGGNDVDIGGKDTVIGGGAGGDGGDSKGDKEETGTEDDVGGNGGNGGSAIEWPTSEGSIDMGDSQIAGGIITGGNGGNGGSGGTPGDEPDKSTSGNGGTGGTGGSVKLPENSKPSDATAGDGGNGGTANDGTGGTGGTGGEASNADAGNGGTGGTATGESDSAKPGNGGTGGSIDSGSTGKPGNGGDSAPGGKPGHGGTGSDNTQGRPGTTVPSAPVEDGQSGTTVDDIYQDLVDNEDAIYPGSDGIEITYDPEKGYVIKLEDDYDGTLHIPDTWGKVTIDLNGHDINGEPGKPAIEFGSENGNGTAVDIVNSRPSVGGSINGGDGTSESPAGSPAISAEDGFSNEGSITVGPGVVVNGGDGYDAASGTGGTGGAGIDLGIPITVNGGVVNGGNGGDGQTGGAGGDGIASSSDVTVKNNGSVTGGDAGKSSGGAGAAEGGSGIESNGGTVTVEDSAVQGGNGGNNIGSGAGGNGGDGISGTPSDIDSDGSTITGGNGGSSGSGAGGNGGSGISTDSGSPNIDIDDSHITGGDGGAGNNSASTSGTPSGNGGSGINTGGNVQIDDSTVSGGNGGDGNDATGENQNGGAGGNGGDAITGSGTLDSDNTDFTGGNGGNGGDASNGTAGNGGDGGSPIDKDADSTSSDSITGGDIAGGNGGNGGNGAAGGNGGNGGDVSIPNNSSPDKVVSGDGGNGGDGTQATVPEGGSITDNGFGGNGGDGGDISIGSGSHADVVESGSGGDGGNGTVNGPANETPSSEASDGNHVGGNGGDGGLITGAGNSTDVSAGDGGAGGNATNTGSQSEPDDKPAATGGAGGAGGDTDRGSAGDGGSGGAGHGTDTDGGAGGAGGRGNGATGSSGNGGSGGNSDEGNGGAGGTAGTSSNDAAPGNNGNSGTSAPQAPSDEGLEGAIDRITEGLSDEDKKDVTVTFDPEKGYVIKLEDDIEGTLTIPDDLGKVTVDMNGHNIAGKPGEPAIEVVHVPAGEDAPARTGVVVDIINSNPTVGGTITGGDGFMDTENPSDSHPDGSPAISVDPTVPNGSITVNGGVEVVGGDGAGAGSPLEDGNAGAGGAGIDADVPITVTDGGKVSGGDGGSSQNGNGGAGGAGIETTEDVTVTDGGKVSGGDGGYGSTTGSDKVVSGDGGDGIVTDGGDVTISGGSEVSGGDGGGKADGNEAPGSDGGNGGSGVSGYPDNVVVDNSTVTGGDAGDGGNGTGTAPAGDGGQGGTGIDGAQDAEVSNGSTVGGGQGGEGGDGKGDTPGGAGGAGGDGISSIVGDTDIDDSVITGGNAGVGGDSENGQAGTGGQGGDAVDVTGTVEIDNSTATGGDGAQGGDATGTGSGGDGGDGGHAVNGGDKVTSGNSDLTGGDGAQGGDATGTGSGGDGGDGASPIESDGNVTVTDGDMSGGDAGAGGDSNNGQGGAGGNGGGVNVPSGSTPDNVTTGNGGAGGSTTGNGMPGAGGDAGDKTGPGTPDKTVGGDGGDGGKGPGDVQGPGGDGGDAGTGSNTTGGNAGTGSPGGRPGNGAVSGVSEDGIADFLEKVNSANTETGFHIDKSDVRYDPDKGFVIEIDGEVSNGIVIPDNVGKVTIDLNGNDVKNPDGPAISIDHVDGGTGADVSIVSEDEEGKPIAGSEVSGGTGADGNGMPGVSVGDGVAGGSISIGPGITVNGGDGAGGTSERPEGGQGGAGIESTVPVTIKDSVVNAGDGGDALAGSGSDGGDGGAAVDVTGGGRVDIDDSQLNGGNGGNGASDSDGPGGDGGNGGPAVSAPSSNVTADRSDLVGGNGGDAGNGGGTDDNGAGNTGGDGGDGGAGTAPGTTINSTDSDISGGNGGAGGNGADNDLGAAGSGGNGGQGGKPVSTPTGSQITGGVISGGNGGDAGNGGTGNGGDSEESNGGAGGQGGNGGDVTLPNGSRPGSAVAGDGGAGGDSLNTDANDKPTASGSGQGGPGGNGGSVTGAPGTAGNGGAAGAGVAGDDGQPAKGGQGGTSPSGGADGVNGPDGATVKDQSSLDVIKNEITDGWADADKDKVDVTQDPDGTIHITVKDDVEGTLTIPDDLGKVVIDTGGHTITGKPGEPAIEITHEGDDTTTPAGTGVDVTITGGGNIIGGDGFVDGSGSSHPDGAPAISVDPSVPGGSITVDGNTTITGGNGHEVTSEGATTEGTGGAGGAGIESDIPVTVEDGTVSGGNGGDNAAGPGGNGGSGITGGADVTVNQDGTVSGGNGGQGGPEADGSSTGTPADGAPGGNGGSGIDTTGRVEVNGGTVQGGDGGTGADAQSPSDDGNDPGSTAGQGGQGGSGIGGKPSGVETNGGTIGGGNGGQGGQGASDGNQDDGTSGPTEDGADGGVGGSAIDIEGDSLIDLNPGADGNGTDVVAGQGGDGGDGAGDGDGGDGGDAGNTVDAPGSSISSEDTDFTGSPGGNGGDAPGSGAGGNGGTGSKPVGPNAGFRPAATGGSMVPGQGGSPGMSVSGDPGYTGGSGPSNVNTSNSTNPPSPEPVEPEPEPEPEPDNPSHGGGGGGTSSGTDVDPEIGDDDKIYITVKPEAGKEYNIRDESGNLVYPEWESGTGEIVFGPLEPGQDYEVVSRAPGSTTVTVEETVETPEEPEIVVTGTSSESVTIATEQGVRYEITDSAGKVVATFTGDGSEHTVSGLDPNETYYATATSEKDGMKLEVGPQMVRPPMDANVTGITKHDQVYIHVDDENGWEYRVVDENGNVVFDWTSPTDGQVSFGPLPEGDYVIEGRDPATGETVYDKNVDVPIMPSRVTSDSDSLTVTTEDSNKKYMLTDKDGNSIPGPNGEVWVTGTGGDVTWPGLDPSEDYFLWIQTGEGEDALLFGPETVKTGTHEVTVTGQATNDRVTVTVDNMDPSREYAVVDSNGNVVGGWVPGTEGSADFSGLEFGEDYKVVSRPAGSNETTVEEEFTVPAKPVADIVGSTDTTVTVDTDEGVRYQVVDSHGNPVLGPDGQVWVEGTGGEVTWSGLDPEEDYYIYAETEDGIFQLETGPVHVKPAREPAVGGVVTDEGCFVKVTTTPGKEYAVVGDDGSLIVGWTPEDGSGSLLLGPIAPGTSFQVIERDQGTEGDGEVIGGATFPEVPSMPGTGDVTSGEDGTTLTVPTEEGLIYIVTDEDGNPVPGPGGAIQVVGTGEDMTWTGLDPEKDYSLTVKVPAGDFTVTVGPELVRPAVEGGEAAVGDGDRCYTWIVIVLVLVVYMLFLLLVHREGEYDRLAWMGTLVALVVDAVLLVLGDLCGWCVVALALTLAVMAVMWWHYNRQVENSEEEEV